MTLTAERARSLLAYDPMTGQFSGDGVRYGQKASSTYRKLLIDGRLYGAHRVAWLIMTGEWPDHEIDHINRDKSDNRWVNLRAATHAENACNGPRQRHNKSGYRGVHFAKHAGKWRAQIHIGDKTHSLGYFDTPEEAYRCRMLHARICHGEFAGE